MNYKIIYSNELYHHGIKGQRWGVRRFQNEDGSLTSAGKKRYEVLESDRKNFGRRGAKRIAKNMSKKNMTRAQARVYESDRRKYGRRGANRIQKRMKKQNISHNEALEKEFVRTLLVASGSIAARIAISRHPEVVLKGAAAAANAIKKAVPIVSLGVDTFARNHSLGKYKNVVNVAAQEVSRALVKV